jgi:hypothetical protein
MMMLSTRALGSGARFIVVGILFVASLAGMYWRPMQGSPDEMARSTAPRLSLVATSPIATAKAAQLAAYGDLPLRFEANRGQTDPQVNFISRAAGSAFFLTPKGAVLTLDVPSQPDDRSTEISAEDSLRRNARSSSKRVALQMSLEGVNPSVAAHGVDRLPGTSNYFIGNNPRKWRTNVPAYAKVRYAGIYPGVDLIYYGNRRALEYDFVLAPGADPSRIRLKIAGADSIAMSPDGGVALKTAAGEVNLALPQIYQLDRGARQPVHGGYFLASRNEIQFRLGAYDHTRELVIDPVLQYSTFLGGTTSDSATAIAIDSAANAYVTGQTSSADFPTTSGALQTSLRGSKNAFITKLNSTATALIYSTYLGGLSGNGDAGLAIAIDSAGDAYVTGVTTSSSFPTVNPVQSTLKSTAGNAFVSELNPTGSALVFSTYLGGSGIVGDLGTGIATGPNGSTYVTGVTTSSDFPLKNPIQNALKNAVSAAFVSDINASGSTFAYSTYLGGSGAAGDSGAAIAVDSSGDAYVTGATSSTDFATTSGAYQSALKGTGFNAFMTEINPGGTAFLYSTYLGGSTANGGLGFGIALDSNNNTYLTGLTSAPDFPITSGAAQSTLTGTGGHAFVSKINPSASRGASLIYSTYLGGSNNAAVADIGLGIAVDATGNANVTGTATSTDFPVTTGAFQSTLKSTGGNAFVTRLSSDGTMFLYSTCLGGSNANGDSGLGIALDSNGAAYIAGRTSSADFPTTSGVIRPNFSAASGQSNGFISKLTANAVVSVTPAAVDFGNVLLNKSGPAQLVTFTNNSSLPLTLSPAPTLSGLNVSEFVISSACGTPQSPITLQPNQSCFVTLNFTPIVFGVSNATLTFYDNDPSSPQIVPITGTGYQDFTITATTPAAVSPGNTSTFTVSVSPIDNSTQTVAITCEGAPAGTTCVLAPPSLVLDGTDTASAIGTITVNSSIGSGSAALASRGKSGGRGLPVLALLGFVAIVAFAMARRRSLRLGFVATALVCLLFVGCSSGRATNPGNYTLQILGTASPGGQSHYVTITLTITS